MKIRYRCGAPVQSITAKRYGSGGTGLCRKPVREPDAKCVWHTERRSNDF